MGRYLHTARASAWLLVHAPLFSHAFLPSANRFVASSNAIGQRNHVHKQSQQLRMSAPQFGGITHAGVLVSDTKASKDFYVTVLGFEDESFLRPDDKLPFDGAFVRAGATQIHLMELPNPHPVDGRPEPGG
ncbi:unnamed protein product, partial [Hapterophycus canaliculatus]